MARAPSAARVIFRMKEHRWGEAGAQSGKAERRKGAREVVRKTQVVPPLSSLRASPPLYALHPRGVRGRVPDQLRDRGCATGDRIGAAALPHARHERTFLHRRRPMTRPRRSRILTPSSLWWVLK